MEYLIFEYYSCYEKIPSEIFHNEKKLQTIFWIGREPPEEIPKNYKNFYFLPEPEYLSYGIRPDLISYTHLPNNNQTILRHDNKECIFQWNRYYLFGSIKLHAKRSIFTYIPPEIPQYQMINYQPSGDFHEENGKYYWIPGFLPSNKLIKPKQLEIGDWVSYPGITLHTIQIRAENLLGFKTVRELNFQQKETLLIIGPNQAGKSSWVDIWCFALWGKTSRVRPKGILRTNQQFGWVEVIFQDSNNKKGRIRREIVRVGGPLSENVKTTLKVSEQLNDKWIPWIPPAKRGDLQDTLNEWIGTWKTVQETAVIGIEMQEQIIKRTPNEWQKILSQWLLLGKTTHDFSAEMDEPNQEKQMDKFVDLTSRIIQLMENPSIEEDEPENTESYSSPSQSITLNELQKVYNVLTNIGIEFYKNEVKLSNKEIQNELKKINDKTFTSPIQINTKPRMPTNKPDYDNIRQEIREIVDTNPNFYGKQCKLLETAMNEILHKFGFHFFLHWGNHFQLRFVSNKTKVLVDSELKQGCRFEKIVFSEIIRMMTRFIFHHGGVPVWETTWIDESWDGSDSSNIRKLVKHFSRTSKQTIIISHQSELKKLLGNILSF